MRQRLVLLMITMTATLACRENASQVSEDLLVSERNQEGDYQHKWLQVSRFGKQTFLVYSHHGQSVRGIALSDAVRFLDQTYQGNDHTIALGMVNDLLTRREGTPRRRPTELENKVYQGLTSEILNRGLGVPFPKRIRGSSFGPEYLNHPMIEWSKSLFIDVYDAESTIRLEDHSEEASQNLKKLVVALSEISKLSNIPLFKMEAEAALARLQEAFDRTEGLTSKLRPRETVFKKVMDSAMKGLLATYQDSEKAI